MEAKMRHFKPILLILGLALVACSQASAEPDPFDLPTAIPPEVPPSRGAWAIPFIFVFPPTFWEQGQHQYAIDVDCPDGAGGDVQSQAHTIIVTEDAQIFDSPLYLRLYGPSTSLIGQPSGPFIHPEQTTIAAVTILGVSTESVDVVSSECEVRFFWDDQPPEFLSPQDPFRQ
jgi:hypothetical protein